MKTKLIALSAVFAAFTLLPQTAGAVVIPPSYTGTVPKDGKQYYIYNIGSGMYLTHGSSWGMHLTVDGAGRSIAIGANTNGTHVMHHTGIDIKKYQSEDCWADHFPPGSFIFEEAPSDKFENAFYIKCSNGDYLCWEGGHGIYGDEVSATYDLEDNDNYKWVFYPIRQRKDLRNGKDATYLLKNGDFTTLIDGNNETPVLELWDTDFWGNKTKQANVSAIFAEKWVGPAKPSFGKEVKPGVYYLNDCHLEQTAKIPAGKYSLSVTAWAVQHDEDVEVTGAYLFAGDKQVPLGKNDVYSVEFEADGNGTRIGIRAENTNANWIACDKFRLTVIEGTVGALASVLKEGKTAEAENWYKIEITESGSYKLSLPEGGYINYTTESKAYPSDVPTTLQDGDKIKLQVGYIYVKSSKDTPIVFSK